MYGVIKQNQSDEGKINFKFFYLIAYTFCKPTFWEKKLQLVFSFRGMSSFKGLQNNRKKEALF